MLPQTGDVDDDDCRTRRYDTDGLRRIPVMVSRFFVMGTWTWTWTLSLSLSLLPASAFAWSGLLRLHLHCLAVFCTFCAAARVQSGVRRVERLMQCRYCGVVRRELYMCVLYLPINKVPFPLRALRFPRRCKPEARGQVPEMILDSGLRNSQSWTLWLHGSRLSLSFVTTLRTRMSNEQSQRGLESP